MQFCQGYKERTESGLAHLTFRIRSRKSVEGITDFECCSVLSQTSIRKPWINHKAFIIRTMFQGWAGSECNSQKVTQAIEVEIHLYQLAVCSIGTAFYWQVQYEGCVGYGKDEGQGRARSSRKGGRLDGPWQIATTQYQILSGSMEYDIVLLCRDI